VADLVGEQRINLSCNSQMKLGTWNVRSMLTGKLEAVKAEMKRLDLAVLGSSETRWQGQGHFNSGDVRVVMSSQSEGRRNGVTIVCDKSSAWAIMGYDTVNDRILSVRFRGKETNTTIIQIYAPTSTTEEEIRERFYTDLQAKLDRFPTGDTIW